MCNVEDMSDTWKIDLVVNLMHHLTVFVLGVLAKIHQSVKARTNMTRHEKGVLTKTHSVVKAINLLAVNS